MSDSRAKLEKKIRLKERRIVTKAVSDHSKTHRIQPMELTQRVLAHHNLVLVGKKLESLRDCFAGVINGDIHMIISSAQMENRYALLKSYALDTIQGLQERHDLLHTKIVAVPLAHLGIKTTRSDADAFYESFGAYFSVPFSTQKTEQQRLKIELHTPPIKINGTFLVGAELNIPVANHENGKYEFLKVNAAILPSKPRPMLRAEYKPMDLVIMATLAKDSRDGRVTLQFNAGSEKLEMTPDSNRGSSLDNATAY